MMPTTFTTDPSTMQVDSTQPGTDLTLYQNAGPLLLAGGALGCAAVYLMWDEPNAPGFAVWLTLVAAAALWLARKGGRTRIRSLGIWSASAVGAASILAFRDLLILVPAMLLVIITSAMLVVLETGGSSLRTTRLREHLLAFAKLPLLIASLTPRLFWQLDLNAVTRHPLLPGILRGVVMALPILAIFFMLFAAADAAFNSYAMAMTRIFSPRTWEQLFKALVFGWIAGSLLVIACRKPHTAAAAVPAPLNLGTMEAGVILGLVTVLFSLFVVLQLGYLFGGIETIERTSGLTLAEYARRGFFELLVVAGLTLALLLGLGATNCDRRLFHRFGTALVLCVLVILASAMQRLFLYTDAFGLTIDRFNAVAVMLWQAFNLISFAATVLRGRIESFAAGLAISGIASVLLLGLANPAAMVAKINLDRAFAPQATAARAPLDLQYLLLLGADAVPVILERFDDLSALQRCEVALHVNSRYPVAADGSLIRNADWRSWNASRAAAHQAVAARHEQLQAC